jgi:hypothetical protein
MPVGNPTYFEGDILKYSSSTTTETKPFGIFKAKIEALENIEIPILQIKTQHNNTRTILPLGK